MSGSTIPAAVTQLAAVFTAAAPGLQVLQLSGYDPGASFIAIGWDREDTPSISFDLEAADAGDVVGLESYDVSCLLSLYQDSAAVTVPFAAVFATFNLLDAAVAGNRTLNGAVMKARVTNGDVTPYFAADGACIELRFTVHIQAFK